MKLADHWFERYISVCIWYAGSIDVNRNQGTLCINWGSLFYLEKIEMEPENVARDRSNEARTTSFAVWPLTSVSTRLYAQQYRLSDSVLRIQLQNRSVKITGVWRTSAAIRWTLPRTCSGRSAETSAFALRRFRPGALIGAFWRPVGCTVMEDTQPKCQTTPSSSVQSYRCAAVV